MAYRVIIIAYVIATLTVFSGCQQKQERQDNVDTQLDEMQEEIRLVIKELVALNTKLDVLSSKYIKPNNTNSKLDVNVVKLPTKNKGLGSGDAKYAMVEFMDYQCPYCVRYAKQTLPTLRERYIDSGQLQYFIRDYPLDFHSKAEGAAIAANCAGEQSEYWPMHDLLVKNFRRLGSDLYRQLAQDIGLDIETFSQCQLNPEMMNAVRADFRYGSEIGTRGTPSFYIGKIEGDTIVDVKHISGARSVEAFDRAIQQAMSSN